LIIFALGGVKNNYLVIQVLSVDTNFCAGRLRDNEKKQINGSSCFINLILYKKIHSARMVYLQSKS